MSILSTITGSSLVGAGASLLGNLIGSANQSSVNKTNMQIAQMNNEFNERMMQKQMDYNTEMWNKENAYNTPAAQAQRLRDAGLNPALMMGQGQTGTASSANGVSAPTAQGVTVNPYNPDFSSIGQILQTAVSQQQAQERNNAEIEQIHIENQYRAQKLMAEIAQNEANARDTRSRAMLNEIQAGMQERMLQSEYQLNLRQAESLEQQTRNAVTQGLLMSKELAIFDQKARMDIANMSADVMLKQAQQQLTDEQAKHEYEKLLETVARANGIKLDNDIKEKTGEYLVEQAKNAAALRPNGLYDLPFVLYERAKKMQQTSNDKNRRVNPHGMSSYEHAKRNLK